jgi:hypothetical protein
MYVELALAMHVYLMYVGRSTRWYAHYRNLGNLFLSVDEHSLFILRAFEEDDALH